VNKLPQDVTELKNSQGTALLIGGVKEAFMEKEGTAGYLY
jgi:hypothetical protein